MTSLPSISTSHSRANANEPESDHRWATVARLAYTACAASTGLVALRQGGRFVIVGISGLQGPIEHLPGEPIFAQTVRQAGDIVEVVAGTESLLSLEPPFRHFAAIAVMGRQGEELGVIAILSTEGRMLSAGEREGLQIVAEGVRTVLERPAESHQPRTLSHLHDQAEELLGIFASCPEPALLYERSHTGMGMRVIAANSSFGAHFGVNVLPDEQSPLLGLLGERSDHEILIAVRAAGEAGRPMRATLAMYPHGQRDVCWMEILGYPVNLLDGRSLWVEQFRDVTDKVQRQNEIITDRGRLQRTLASMADAVITFDTQGRLRYMNNAARTLLDLRVVIPVERGIHPDERLFQLRDIDTEEPLVEPFMITTEPRKARALVITHSGARRYVEYVVSEVERPQFGPDGVVVLLRDITAEEVQTRRLSFEASHDQLTGIANRRRFDQALARALASAKAESQQHTLAFLDLDRFKAINDNCGHAAGDQVLREIAQLFKGQLRSHDVIARFGGDEFAILMHDCTPKTATRVINRIRAAIAMYRWHWQGRDYTLGVSIGLAEITQRTSDAEYILREADAACYADKATHHQHERHLPTVVSDLPPPTNRVSWTR